MEQILTPDNVPVSNDGMCTCSTHCSDKCELGHCPFGTPWCTCFCHTDEYRKMKERNITEEAHGSNTPPVPPKGFRAVECIDETWMLRTIDPNIHVKYADRYSDDIKEWLERANPSYVVSRSDLNNQSLDELHDMMARAFRIAAHEGAYSKSEALEMNKQLERLIRLFDIVTNWRDEQQVTAEESIYQCDNVQLSLYSLASKLLAVVGPYEEESVCSKNE